MTTAPYRGGMGVVRLLQLAVTVVVAGPAALVGVLAILDGHVEGAVFIGLAVAFVVLSEYLYLRLTDRAAGRLRRLVPGR